MAVEAVARVIRSGGEASRMLEGLADNARDALAQLERINPAVAQSARAWETLHAAVQSGAQLSGAQLAQYNTMGASLRRQAEEAARVLPPQPPAAPGRGTPPAIAEPPKPPPTATVAEPPKPPTAVAAGPPKLPSTATVAPRPPAPLTTEEAEHLRGLGYEEHELARAQPIGGGRYVIPQPEPFTRGGPVPPAPDMQAQTPAAPGMLAQPPAPAAPPPRQAAVEEAIAEADQEEETSRRQERAHERITRVKGQEVRSERELRQEWRASQVELRKQEGDIDRQVNALERLKHSKKLGAETERDDHRRKLADLYQGRNALVARQAQLRDEIHDAGMRIEGDFLASPERPGGGASTALRALAGGMVGTVAGGDGIGNVAAGAMTGALGGWMIPAMAGLAGFRWWWGQGQQYQSSQEQIFNAGMRLGGGGGMGRFPTLRTGAEAALRGPLRLSVSESLGAELAYATQTGRDVAPEVLAFARAYGLSPEAMGGTFGALGAMGYAPQQRITRREVRPAQRIEDQTQQALAALAERQTTGGPLRMRMGAEPTRIVETARGGLPALVAGAYERAGYGRTGNALMEPFLQHYVSLMTRTGNAPVADYGPGAGLFGEAARTYTRSGRILAPQYGAELAGGFMQMIAQPQGEVARGLALRSVMRLGREWGPEGRAKFAAATEPMVPGGGVDPTTFMGAQWTVRNAFRLPAEQQQQIVGAILGSLRGVVGKGPAAEIAFTQLAGGNETVGLQLARSAERLAGAPITERGPLTQQFLDLFAGAGEEKRPWMLAKQQEEQGLAVGESAARLSQNMQEAVYNFIRTMRETLNTWEQSGLGANMSPAPAVHR